MSWMMMLASVFGVVHACGGPNSRHSGNGLGRHGKVGFSRSARRRCSEADSAGMSGGREQRQGYRLRCFTKWVAS